MLDGRVTAGYEWESGECTGALQVVPGRNGNCWLPGGNNGAIGNGRARRCAGLSLIEVAIFISTVSVAMLATLSSYVRYLQMKTSTEQHRAAQIAAEEKFDEIRSFISRVRLGTAKDANGATVPLNSNPLDAAFNLYGPTPAITGLQRPCCFSVPNLTPIGNAAVGTVTIINTETPDATQFGYAYDGTTAPKIFGVNLYQNTYGDGGFPATLPPAAPFPLDLDGDGLTTNNNVTSNFSLLPVVVTVRWRAPDGSLQRLDLFSLLSAEQGTH